MSQPVYSARWLKSAVLGANDGIVTTFAVVAGVSGAGLSPKIIIILGLANMIADGISMAMGDYLGERSEWQLQKQKSKTITADRDLWHTGLITFIAFLTAGSLPLMPYFLRVLGVPIPIDHQLTLSVIATAFTLFFVGSLRTIILDRAWWKNGLEMLAVGSVAAIVAYIIGDVIEKVV